MITKNCVKGDQETISYLSAARQPVCSAHKYVSELLAMCEGVVTKKVFHSQGGVA